MRGYRRRTQAAAFIVGLAVLCLFLWFKTARADACAGDCRIDFLETVKGCG